MIDFTVSDIKFLSHFLKSFSDYLESEEVDADGAFDSRLVCCELVSNVLKHCGEPAHFNGVITDEEVIIKVDGGRAFKGITPTLPEVLAESGRGLYIVNEVSGGNVSFNGDKVTVILKRR